MAGKVGTGLSLRSLPFPSLKFYNPISVVQSALNREDISWALFSAPRQGQIGTYRSGLG